MTIPSDPRVQLVDPRVSDDIHASVAVDYVLYSGRCEHRDGDAEPPAFRPTLPPSRLPVIRAGSAATAAAADSDELELEGGGSRGAVAGRQDESAALAAAAAAAIAVAARQDTSTAAAAAATSTSTASVAVAAAPATSAAAASAAPAAHALASCRSRPCDSGRDATVRRCARARGMLVPPRSRMAAGAHTLTAKVRHTVERKQYAGSRGTVCDIVRDSDVTSNEIYCCLGWTCLLQIAVTEGFNTAHLMIAENHF